MSSFFTSRAISKTRSLSTVAERSFGKGKKLEVQHRRLPELSNLPKSPTPLRSLRFRGVLDGSPYQLVYPGKRWYLSKVVDPSHPSATRSVPRDFPSYTSSLFRLRAFPSALLEHYANDACFPFEDGHPLGRKLKPPESDALTRAGSQQFPESPPGMEDRDNPLKARSDRGWLNSRSKIPLGLVNVLSKKSVHSSAVVRVKVKLRMKETLRLVVVRGAAVDSNGTIIFNKEEIGDNYWLVKDWVYVFQPTLGMFRHPYPGIISEVRTALRQLKQGAHALQKSWEESPSSPVSRITSEARGARGGPSSKDRRITKRKPRPKRN